MTITQLLNEYIDTQKLHPTNSKGRYTNHFAYWLQDKVIELTKVNELNKSVVKRWKRWAHQLPNGKLMLDKKGEVRFYDKRPPLNSFERVKNSKAKAVRVTITVSFA
jgi:hypothetical protein